MEQKIDPTLLDVSDCRGCSRKCLPPSEFIRPYGGRVGMPPRRFKLCNDCSKKNVASYSDRKIKRTCWDKIFGEGVIGDILMATEPENNQVVFD